MQSDALPAVNGNARYTIVKSTKQKSLEKSLVFANPAEKPLSGQKNEWKASEVSMGCVDTITAYNFPKQSEYVNRRCKVCFHYNTTKWIMGTVIRDDREEPYETLIRLDDGRVIRGVECQFSFSI